MLLHSIAVQITIKSTREKKKDLNWTPFLRMVKTTFFFFLTGQSNLSDIRLPFDKLLKYFSDKCFIWLPLNYCYCCCCCCYYCSLSLPLSLHFLQFHSSSHSLCLHFNQTAFSYNLIFDGNLTLWCCLALKKP